ncbi:MAG: TRAP transporter substrate-binding protein [Betaproteobacteria bacterium]
MKIGILATFILFLAGAASAQEVRIGLDSPPDAVRSGSYVFAKVLGEQLSASGFTVKELPVNSIGGEAERLDQTTQGLLEVDMADLARAAQLNKLTFGFNLPYLYDSLAHLDRADATGGLLAKVNEGVIPKGARILALVAVGGGTGIFNTKHEISKPDDMADLRMRGLDENQMKLFKAWGTNGVVITMPEVANALQTGIASGYINPPFVPFLFGHGSILKYYTPANVAQSLRVAMVSEDWYKKLPADRKAAFDAAVVKATAANRAWVKTSDEQAMEQVAKAGMKITPLTPEGRKEFQDRSRTSWTAILSEAEIKPFVDAANKTR